jgi:Spy/CpxP family protein refolding chaperone
MKLKTLSFIAGAIALTLTATPFIVKAQTSDVGEQQPNSQVHKKGNWQKLNLTDSQKQQMRDIRQAARTKIEAVLTPDQLAKFKAEHPEGQEGKREHVKHQGGRFASLNLTPDQKTQIKKIMQESREEVKGVLTPEQQKQMQEFRKNHHHKGDNAVTAVIN